MMSEVMFMKDELYKFQFFIELVDEDRRMNKYKGGRKPLISTTYYLDKILFVLTTGLTWSHLQRLNIICHYSAIFKKFNIWVRKGFIDILQDNLLSVYMDVFKPTSNCSFMDSTDILNVNGSKKYTNYGRKFKSKRAIKLHTRCDENKITHAAYVTPANVMDVTLIEQLVNNNFIQIEKTYRKPHYVVGDKGYISDKIYKKLRKQNIILTYPFRKNQPNTNSKHKKELLKKRFNVEHSYNYLKRKWKRINKFCERRIANYMAFIKLANSIMIMNFLLENL